MEGKPSSTVEFTTSPRWEVKTHIAGNDLQVEVAASAG